MDAGDRVYVRGFSRRGEAEVVRMVGDDSVRVRWPDGKSTTHARAVVEYTRQPITMVTVLERASTTDVELQAVPKPETCRDERYLAWVRTQPCAHSGVTTVQASHHPREGGGSTSMKCSDRRTLPLAPTVHYQFTTSQRIGNMSPEQTRQWVEERLNEHLERYIDHLEGK